MSGELTLALLVILCLLIGALGFYCHFCFGESGGRSFALMDDKSPPSAPTIVFVTKKKCRCSDKFKGLCKSCEGEEFVGADGGYRDLDDFNDYGGDKGFDENGTSTNPIQGMLGNNSHSHSHSSGTEANPHVEVVYVTE